MRLDPRGARVISGAPSVSSSHLRALSASAFSCCCTRLDIALRGGAFDSVVGCCLLVAPAPAAWCVASRPTSRRSPRSPAGGAGCSAPGEEGHSAGGVAAAPRRCEAQRAADERARHELPRHRGPQRRRRGLCRRVWNEAYVAREIRQEAASRLPQLALTSTQSRTGCTSARRCSRAVSRRPSRE